MAFLKQVIVKNYKSIAACDVDLPDLCFLVGRNGSGKSNFLDALRLVSDSLNTSLDHALRERSGINEVRRRSSGHPTHFEIGLHFGLRCGETGSYWFRVGSRTRGGFEVQQEKCYIHSPRNPSTPSHYLVMAGQVISCSVLAPPVAKDDRLYLVSLSGLDEFRPLYDSLSRMGFYNLNPDAIRAEQPPDAGWVLNRDGSNIASVLQRMQASAPEARQRVEEFLSKVTPNIREVTTRTVLSKETLEFPQATRGASSPWRFLAANMSDGTLRALGILVALFQEASMAESPTPLIGIEEPECALHPAAAAVLRDALRMASRRTQVLVTSHSPELLDDPAINAGSLIAASNEGGVTGLAPVDQAALSSIRDGLFTAGELLRADQLAPDAVDLSRQQRAQLNLPWNNGR